MARKIQIKRGNKANLPTLAQGELAYCQDEQSLYIGSSSGNKPVGGKAITPALIGAATTAQVNAAASAASAAQTAANSKVSKSGDTVNGVLTAVTFDINRNNTYAAFTVDTENKGAMLQTSDDSANGCALSVSTSKGLQYMAPDGNRYPVYHAGNKLVLPQMEISNEYQPVLG